MTSTSASIGTDSSLPVVSVDMIARIGELLSTLGLIITCLLLYRFFRGGIMQLSFALFASGSIFFFVGVSIALLVENRNLPTYPFDAIHLVFEIIFVIFLLSGLVLLYERWIGQHEDPHYGSEITRQTI